MAPNTPLHTISPNPVPTSTAIVSSPVLHVNRTSCLTTKSKRHHLQHSRRPFYTTINFAHHTHLCHSLHIEIDSFTTEKEEEDEAEAQEEEEEDKDEEDEENEQEEEEQGRK